MVEDVSIDRSDLAVMPTVTLCATSYNDSAFSSGPTAQHDFDIYCPGKEGQEFVNCINNLRYRASYVCYYVCIMFGRTVVRTDTIYGQQPIIKFCNSVLIQTLNALRKTRTIPGSLRIN